MTNLYLAFGLMVIGNEFLEIRVWHSHIGGVALKISLRKFTDTVIAYNCEITPDKSNVVRICIRGNYEHKWIPELFCTQWLNTHINLVFQAEIFNVYNLLRK